MKKEHQVQQLSHLIVEFYPGARVYKVDTEQEVIHFDVKGEEDIPMKAIVDRCKREIIFKYFAEDEWCYHKYASFDSVNEVNEVPFL